MNELLHYVDFCPCVCHQNLEHEFHALPYIYTQKFSQQSLSKTADVMGCLKNPLMHVFNFFIVLISFSN